MSRLPKRNTDLCRYVLFRDLRRTLGFLLWIALWIGGAISYNQNHQTYPDDRLIKGWRMVLYAAVVAAFGFLIFRMWRLFTDRTLSGTIVSSGLSHTYSASPDPGLTQKLSYDFRLNTAIKVKCEDGKVRRIQFEQKHGFYHYYHEGNRIIRFHGLPYPINLDPDAPHGYVCAACGYWSETATGDCEACRHSLIDPKELQL